MKHGFNKESYADWRDIDKREQRAVDGWSRWAGIMAAMDDVLSRSGIWVRCETGPWSSGEFPFLDLIPAVGRTKPIVIDDARFPIDLVIYPVLEWGTFDSVGEPLDRSTFHFGGYVARFVEYATPDCRIRYQWPVGHAIHYDSAFCLWDALFRIKHGHRNPGWNSDHHVYGEARVHLPPTLPRKDAPTQPPSENVWFHGTRYKAWQRRAMGQIRGLVNDLWGTAEGGCLALADGEQGQLALTGGVR